jgi:tRNA (guanine26-N2/guanine27-N2)-dimethyltransferase
MATSAPSIVIPQGFTLHTENATHVLIDGTSDAFLNPIQEFNRDLSIACITVWSEEYSATKKAKWLARQERQGPPAKKTRRERPSITLTIYIQL